MDFARYLIVGALLTGLIGCTTPPADTPRMACTCGLNQLSEAELAENTAMGEAGDIGAMRKLVLHFADTNEVDASWEWSLRLAESGDKEAQEEIVCRQRRLDRRNGTTLSSELAAKWDSHPNC